MTPVTLKKIYSYAKQDKNDPSIVTNKYHYVDCTIDTASVESIIQYMDPQTGAFDSNITEVHMKSGEIIYVQGGYTAVKNIITV